MAPPPAEPPVEGAEGECHGDERRGGRERGLGGDHETAAYGGREDPNVRAREAINARSARGFVNSRTWAYPASGMADRARRRIPEATVARLPVYVRILLEVAESRTATISSERLAEMAGVNAAKVRKDLSYLGSYGTRGVGYDVEYLLFQMSRELGLTHDWPVVIVGAGNLGHALANYGGFDERGFPVAAIVDIDEAKVGTKVGAAKVRHLDDLPDIVGALSDRDRDHRDPGRREPKRSPIGSWPPASRRS